MRNERISTTVKGLHSSFPSRRAEHPQEAFCRTIKPKVAIIREEGSNGDREMISAFYIAGFEAWDVTMTDLLDGRITLDQFQRRCLCRRLQLCRCSGFCKRLGRGDPVQQKNLGTIPEILSRPDTFSLGVCNGCQLMALLGWVPWQGITDDLQPRFIHNRSGRFESRFSTVKILKSPSIMLKGMEKSVSASGSPMAKAWPISRIRTCWRSASTDLAPSPVC